MGCIGVWLEWYRKFYELHGVAGVGDQDVRSPIGVAGKWQAVREAWQIRCDGALGVSYLEGGDELVENAVVAPLSRRC